ncbi:MFS transporter [Amycolatopsis sp. EV170708-02-1]|uniref:MFS transporter n=1 Tax=Amycolatopsis sp. EV170708-02-1 TaxID=2919322 RepID=UPI001F0C74E5|nr:MFS transporter [Amycolatopsis sp. EV170708-02-1]UMP01308.1 MFS transporter [Amycolatopsis sp. EV170708-02-1]
MNAGRKYWLLGGLYISQYLGVAFFNVALTAILRDRGVGLAKIATVQSIGLVWILKFLWAPAIDHFGGRRHGHYRSWLLVLQPLMTVALLVALPLDAVNDLGILMLVVAAVGLLSATQDIATDALAVKVLSPGERGVGNGVQIAGGYLGNIIGGGLVLIVYDHFGWQWAICTLAAATATPFSQILRFREPPAAHAPVERAVRFAAIVSLFRQPGMAVWGFVVLPLAWAGIGGVYALMAPMLVDAGWGLSDVAVAVSVVGGASGIAGAFLAGGTIRRFGRRRTLLTLLIVQIPVILTLLPVALGVSLAWVAVITIVLLQLIYAATLTLIYAVAMDYSRHWSPGTDFTVMSCFASLIGLLAGAGFLAAAGSFGYPLMIGAGAVLAATGAGAVALWFTERTPHTRIGTTEPALATKEIR